MVWVLSNISPGMWNDVGWTANKYHSQSEEFTSLVSEITVVMEQIVVLFTVASDALENKQIL